MTTTNFLVPPPELVAQWSDIKPMENAVVQNWVKIATQAAQWGGDQELEACVEWLDHNSPSIGGFHLRIDRRPKPPSLKEQALNDLDDIPTHDDEGRQVVDLSNIRRALESLDD
jgi:hypothetical protein